MRCKVEVAVILDFMHRGLRLVLILGCFIATFLPGTCLGADWPRFRGPDNNGVSQETDWSAKWSSAGPPIDWRLAVGTGYSSVAIAEGRLYTLGNEENVDTVYCLDAETGKEIWTHSYDCALDANEFRVARHPRPRFRRGWSLL